MKKIDIIVLVGIILISLFALKALFKPDFYTSHDGNHQVVRMYYFDQLLRDGQIPPRYVGGLFNGFGYPLFSFSYHLPWIIAEPFHLVGLSITDSIEATFIVTFILSGITMYIFQRNLFGRTAATAGSFLYLFAPDRFLNIFVRAAVGDATAFIFPPLIFLSAYKLKSEKKVNWKWIGVGAVSLALLVLSHAMVFMFFYLAYVAYLLFSLFENKFHKNILISVVLTNILGLGVSAYYFIPSLMERNYTIFSDLMGPVYTGSTFVSLKNLIYSPWGYGLMNGGVGAMSFQIGIAQWVTVFLTLVLGIALYVKREKLANRKHLTGEGIFYSILFALSIFMMMPLSGPFWNLIKKVAIIDFTWRILPLTVFAVSLMAGFVAYQLKKYNTWFALFIIILAFYSNRNHLGINKTQDYPIPFYLELERTTNDIDEYTPRWAQRNLMKKPVVNKVEYTDNKAFIYLKTNRSNYLNAGVEASAPGQVKINSVYWPGWETYVNGKKVDLNYKSSGFMEIPLTPGHWTVEAKFSETFSRKICDLITISSLGFLGIMFYKFRKS